MRNLILAALAVALVFLAGCQDNEARLQNAKLQAELENLKKQGGNEDLTKLLLAQQQKGGGESLDEVNRKLNSISGDIATGLKNLEKSQEEAAKAQSKRTDELETKLRKVDELQSALVALKAMIETLEGKVKNVDPNQVLDIQKKLLETEAALRAEQESHKKAQADLKAEQERSLLTADEVSRLRAELAELKSSATVESNRKLRDKVTQLEMDLQNATSDRDNIKKQYDDLIEQLRKGGAKLPEGTETPKDPKVEQPPREGVYSFEGTVAAVTGGGKPGEASNVLVNPVSGDAPPEGSELIVLNEKGETICRLKVLRHFFKKDDASKLDQIGCKTVNQKIDNPVIKGYRAVYVKTAPDAGASGN